MEACAYYNEHDKEKAEWLRELIRKEVIAYGFVDERSITEIGADDLRGFTQCHFFAGIGVWSYALRLAGWPDDRPVWTGSCPCPSFSCAGKGQGFDDPRHLWPAWSRLIAECKPATIFGEQADDAIGYGWLDLVQTDLERAAYSVGKAVLGACSVGAPHIRQRLYFVAYSQSMYAERRPINLSGEHGCNRENGRRSQAHGESGTRGEVLAGHMPNSNGRFSIDRDVQRSGQQRLLAEDCGTGQHSNSDRGRFAMHGRTSWMSRHAERAGESGSGQRDQSIGSGLEGLVGDVGEWRGPGWLDQITSRSVAEAGATRGAWSNCDWWYGRDGKYRPIERGLFPLVNGAANRVLKLRGFGDAIVAPLAAGFIEASEEAIAGLRESGK